MPVRLFRFPWHRLLWWPLWALCLLLWHVAAQAVVVLDGSAPGRIPAGQIEHWTDDTAQADLAAAQAAFAAGRFAPTPARHRTAGQGSAHWLRVAIDQPRAHGDGVLALQTTAIDDVRFFGPFDAQGRALAEPVSTGLVQPYANRPLGTERPLMRLQLEQPGRYVVYMRLQSRSAQSLEITASDTVGYIQSRQPKRLFDGLVYGILLALLVYNVVLAYVFRRESYGLYALTCAAALFTLSSYNGHAAHYLLGDWPWWQQRANMLGSALWVGFGTLLCRHFLELPRRLPRLDRVLQALAASAAVAALLALGGQTTWSQHLVELAAAVGTLLAFGAAAWVWRQGFAPAGWYLGGQAVLFLSALAVVGVNWGWLDAPFLLANGLQIGVVAEMLVFAYALSARVRRMRHTHTELRQRADHLAEAAASDNLTGLANRMGLSQRAQPLLDERQPHAVVLLDLDRFKPVNDTYGHEVGDRLLVAVARRLQRQMREGDLVARLGGDEFVVLLNGRHTPAQLAALATRLREAVQAPFVDGDAVMQVDASLGIASYPEHGGSLTELLRHADAAMYRAKQAHTGFALYEPASARA